MLRLTVQSLRNIVVALAVSSDVNDLVGGLFIGVIVELLDGPVETGRMSTGKKDIRGERVTDSLSKVRPPVLGGVDEPEIARQDVESSRVKGGRCLLEETSDNGIVGG